MRMRTCFWYIVLLIAAIAAVPTVGVAAAAQTDQHSESDQRDFGPNVMIFDPSMPTSQIQATVNAIAKQQVDNEMGTQRYALLFLPGTYGSAANPLVFQLGY